MEYVKFKECDYNRIVYPQYMGKIYEVEHAIKYGVDSTLFYKLKGIDQTFPWELFEQLNSNEEKEKNNMKKTKEQIIAELKENDIDVSEFIIEIQKIKITKPNSKFKISREETKYLAEFYKYLNTDSFENAFRESNLYNEIYRKLPVFYKKVVHCYEYDQDDEYRRIKREIFDEKFFKDMVTHDINSFERYGDKHHERVDGKCYIHFRTGNVEYPNQFYQKLTEFKKLNDDFQILRFRYSCYHYLNKYRGMRYAIKNGRIPNFYVQRMKVFLTYVAYRDYVRNMYEGEAQIKMMDCLNKHLSTLISIGEEYKLFYEFKKNIENLNF